MPLSNTRLACEVRCHQQQKEFEYRFVLMTKLEEDGQSSLGLQEWMAGGEMVWEKPDDW